MITLTDKLPPRIADRIVEQDGHWIWQGWCNQEGYPYVHFGGRDQPTYRVVWKLQVGSIPEGMELDHLCVTPKCCNPEHLEVVTHAENQRRIRERYTQCTHGHDWTNPRNVRTRPNGSRYCAECDRISCRARYARNKRKAAA